MSLLLWFVVVSWALIAALTCLARLDEMNGGESAASIAAGVLWPIYLPYRLALLIWSGKP